MDKNPVRDKDCVRLIAAVIERGDRDEEFRKTRLYKHAIELTTPTKKLYSCGSSDEKN